MTPSPPTRKRRHPGTVGEVFLVFLRLGLTSFGGPVAHLGYFREAFVERRKWLGDRAYADLVALCQFLPGPASSQVGMAIGLQRAGFGGLLAAWAGFTLPSAILLVAFAYGVTALGDLSNAGWIHGVKAAAVAVVAHAVLGMARTLTPDAKRATIAVAGMIVVLLVPSAFAQVAVIAAAGIVGLVWLRPQAATASSRSHSPCGCLAGWRSRAWLSSRSCWPASRRSRRRPATEPPACSTCSTAPGRWCSAGPRRAAAAGSRDRADRPHRP